MPKPQCEHLGEVEVTNELEKQFGSYYCAKNNTPEIEETKNGVKVKVSFLSFNEISLRCKNESHKNCPRKKQ